MTIMTLRATAEEGGGDLTHADPGATDEQRREKDSRRQNEQRREALPRSRLGVEHRR